jgi:ActR/RegA family two-component response regulator
MTPDRRLDQLEPVMGEMAAQLDLHTAQLKRIAIGVSTITAAIGEQSDNITFLLTGQANLRTEVAEMKAEQQGVKHQLARIEEQNILILSILQRGSEG